ncbi:MAG: hypothetical protein V4751_13765 [Pseudomonadota bacterium]
MCKGINLDDRQKANLKACIAETQTPGRSLFARLRTSLTMIVIGMYSASSRVPMTYDKHNKLF